MSEIQKYQMTFDNGFVQGSYTVVRLSDHLADKSAAVREAVAQERERWEAAWNDMRDSILHERAGMSEEGMTCDQVNAVLGVIDDADPRAAVREAQQKEVNR